MNGMELRPSTRQALEKLLTQVNGHRRTRTLAWGDVEATIIEAFLDGAAYRIGSPRVVAKNCRYPSYATVVCAIRSGGQVWCGIACCDGHARTPASAWKDLDPWRSIETRSHLWREGYDDLIAPRIAAWISHRTVVRVVFHEEEEAA